MIEAITKGIQMANDWIPDNVAGAASTMALGWWLLWIWYAVVISPRQRGMFTVLGYTICGAWAAYQLAFKINLDFNTSAQHLLMHWGVALVWVGVAQEEWRDFKARRGRINRRGVPKGPTRRRSGGRRDREHETVAGQA